MPVSKTQSLSAQFEAARKAAVSNGIVSGAELQKLQSLAESAISASKNPAEVVLLARDEFAKLAPHVSSKTALESLATAFRALAELLPSKPPKDGDWLGGTTDVKAPTSAKDLSPALIKTATDFVNKMASDEDNKLGYPQFGDDNCGIITGVLAGESATKFVDSVRNGLRSWVAEGSTMWNLMPEKFDPSKQALIVTADSQDEVHLHISTMDLATGKITHLGDVNTVDLGTDEIEDGYEHMAQLARSAVVLQTKETAGGVGGFFEP